MYLKEFLEPSGIHESIFVGYLWSNPDLYRKYRNHTISKDTFTETVWWFYYRLGKEMYDKSIRDFDDVTVYSFTTSQPQESGKKSYFEAYDAFGGFETIEELKEECTKNTGNDEYHFSEIQKYESLRNLQNKGILDGKNEALVNKLLAMNLEQIQTYYNMIHKESFSHVNSGEVIEYDLLDNDEMLQTIEELEEGEDAGLEFYDSPRLSERINGQKLGNLNYLVLPSGVGKSSFITEKSILSLVLNEQKGIIFANEEGVKRWRTRILVTVAARELNDPLARDIVGRGRWKDPNIKKILLQANSWLQKNKKNGHIKFVQLKKYRIEDVINRIELYRARGYSHIYFDTFKPDRTNKDMDRWLAFSNSAQELYDCIKEENQNCATLATVQLKIGKEFKFLDLDCIGKSLEIVEVAAVVMAGRLMYAKEFPGQDEELEIYDWVTDPMNGEKRMEPVRIDPNKEHLILFLPKNREGSEGEQIVFEINYDHNTWIEKGYTMVPNNGR